MSLLQRFGTSRQAEVLCLTIHTINVILPENCLIKVVIRLDSNTKVSTPYTSYDSNFPVTTVESTHSLHVDFFQRKLRTLKKAVKMTLVTLQDVKEVENGRAVVEVQDLSVGGPGLVRTLAPLKKCSDAQGSLCISVSRKLASSAEQEARRNEEGALGQQQNEEVEGRKRQSTLIPLPAAAIPSPFPEALNLDSSSSEEDDEPIIVRRFATVSSAATAPVQVKAHSGTEEL